MSILELDNLSKEELIAQFIIESKEKGFFLLYSDYDLISMWLKEAGDDPDMVLLVLSEILPDYLERYNNRSGKFSLKGIHRRVIKALTDAKKRI